MKISELKEQDELNFNELAQSHGTVFNTLDWNKNFGNKVKPFGIYNEGNELIGGFFLYAENRFGLTFYRNPPFTQQIGPFLKIEAQNPVSIQTTWKKVVTCMVHYIEKLPYSVIAIQMNRNIVDLQPFIWQKFKVIPRYTYILELSMPEEDIWLRMSSERRKNINKATKDGITVKKISDFNIIKILVLNTFSRKGKRINESNLDNILFKFADRSNSFGFASYKSDLLVSAAFFVYDKDTVYYLMGGYDLKMKHHGAGALSMWAAIKYSKNLGLKYFDFEGSMQPNIERYFRGFGGQITPFFTVNKARFPLEMILKCTKRELF